MTWILVLVLAPIVWGQDCEDVQIWKFPVGENATISVEGKTDRGCKFVLQTDDKSCCYMNEIRQQTPDYNICQDLHQSENCVSKTRFSVEEPYGRCILKLVNFMAEDAGHYHVKFPGESRKFNRTKRIEIREKKTETRKIDIGQTTEIFIKGDIKGDIGCKFVVKVDSKTCCYESRKTRMLCKEEEITNGCQTHKVTEEGKNCVFHLNNFKISDVGEYIAIFPNDTSDNEIVMLSVNSWSFNWRDGRDAILSVVGILAIVFCTWKINQLANSEIVNRSWISDQISKDKAIFDIIRSKKGEEFKKKEFKKKLGTKSILKISDHYKNNIMHHAADDTWTKEMTDIVVSHCLTETFPHLHAQAQHSTENEESVFVDTKPWTKYDIFSAKMPDPINWYPAFFPRRLVPHRITINTQNSEGMTPLHIAAGKNLAEAVMSLLENGAKINIRDNKGYSALQKAINSIMFNPLKYNNEIKPPNMQTIEILLKNTPNSLVKPNLTKTNEGENPVHSAVLKNNLQCVELLLKEHSSRNQGFPSLLIEKWVHKKDIEDSVKEIILNETPIELAVRLGHTNIVRFILNQSDTSWHQTEGHHVMELISRAAGGSHSNIVYLLQEKYGEGFDPKYKIDGDTCLAIAIKAENPAAVNILLGLEQIGDVKQDVKLTEQLLAPKIQNNEDAGNLKKIKNALQKHLNRAKLAIAIKSENPADVDILLGLGQLGDVEQEVKLTEQLLALKIQNNQDAGNLKTIKDALQKHIHRAQGNLDPPTKENLSVDTLIEQLQRIKVAPKSLSQKQIYQIQKIMNQKRKTLE